MTSWKWDPVTDLIPSQDQNDVNYEVNNEDYENPDAKPENQGNVNICLKMKFLRNND